MVTRRPFAEEFGRLDALVSNAGVGLAVPVIDMTLADWRRQNVINLDGIFLSCKHCIPLMRRTGGGSIVLMSSAAGLRGAPGMAGYSETKGAVRLFGKSLAMEYGPAVRMNTLHPGIIDTAIWSKIPVDAENSKGEVRSTRAPWRGILRRSPGQTSPMMWHRPFSGLCRTHQATSPALSLPSMER